MQTATHDAVHTRDEATNRRLVLGRFGGIEGMTLVEEDAPAPGPGQVRIRVEAASVQFTDVLIRRGSYPGLKQKPPLTTGYDVIGRVDALGAGVTELRVGDRVADLTVTGSHARYRLLDAAGVVRVPEGVDAAEAAALVLSGVTAYQLLHRHAKVQAGQTILVQGAAGAVGQLLLVLGRRLGLTMAGTCRAEHADLVASLGAIPIDYRSERLADAIPDGVDAVFDGIGVDGFRESWSIVRPGGFLAAYGFSHAAQADIAFPRVAFWFVRVALWNLLPNGKRAGFYSITDMRDAHPDWFRDDLAQLFAWLANGTLRPHVAERLDLGDIPEAHRRLQAGGLRGKLVVIPS